MDDIVFDLELEDEIQSEETSNKHFGEFVEENIVPKYGNYLGLDISINSTGICLYKNGVKEVYNAFVTYDESNPFMEAQMRYDLKNDLLEVIKDTALDAIVIEDVFEGENPKVTRMLYALNTAIDELILDKKVYCREFIRVSNKKWKNWLASIDVDKKYKGFGDKEKIQKYLEMIGIEETGSGFQDRLDATGMLIGYFLNQHNDVKVEKAKKVRVNFSDVEFDYEPDVDLIKLNAAYGEEEIVVIYIEDKTLTKKKILDYLSEDFKVIYITREKIKLGLLAETLNLDISTNDGNYFGFWITNKKQQKYIKKLEERS